MEYDGRNSALPPASTPPVTVGVMRGIPATPSFTFGNSGRSFRIVPSVAELSIVMPEAPPPIA